MGAHIELKQILSDHTLRYRAITARDYVKLVFQHTFGPAHFVNGLNAMHVRAYFMKELAHYTKSLHTPYLESIGNDYVRVSLACISDGFISASDAIQCFLESAKHSELNHKTQTQVFFDHLNTLKQFCDNQNNADAKAVETFINHFKTHDITPISHSDTYKARHHPHYRVMQRTLLTPLCDVDALCHTFPKKDFAGGL